MGKILYPQMTIWRTNIACCLSKATNTYSKYVILIDFPLQQWFKKRASILRYTYFACLEQRETNLMSLALLFHYLLLNMFRMLIHPSSGACELFVGLFHGLYCSGSMCVGVTLWFVWGGVVSGCISI